MVAQWQGFQRLEQAVDMGLLVRGRQGDAQPCLAARHRGRADRADQQALPLERFGGAPAPLPHCPAAAAGSRWWTPTSGSPSARRRARKRSIRRASLSRRQFSLLRQLHRFERRRGQCRRHRGGVDVRAGELDQALDQRGRIRRRKRRRSRAPCPAWPSAPARRAGSGRRRSTLPAPCSPSTPRPCASSTMKVAPSAGAQAPPVRAAAPRRHPC